MDQGSAPTDGLNDSVIQLQRAEWSAGERCPRPRAGGINPVCLLVRRPHYGVSLRALPLPPPLGILAPRRAAPFVWFTYLRTLLHLGLLLCALPVALLRAEPTSPDNRRPAVLTLHSYTSNEWCNGLQAGINHELVEGAQVDMYVDYLDSRKANTPEYREILRQLLVIKYQTVHFDLVIACDDNAYDYVNQYRDQLWPGTPVVFCGVNEFRPEEFARHPDCTGLSENNDLRPFVGAIPRLLPALQTLYVVCDDSSYSHDTLPHLRADLAAALPHVRLQILDHRLTAEELTVQLSRLPPDSAVFFLCFWQDKSGRYISTSEGQRIIVHSSVPVFSTQQNLLGQGAVGVSYVDAFEHGAAAAQVARRVLEGTPIASIPAAIGPARRMGFDYARLRHHGIAPSLIPPGSHVINEPFSFYRKYRTLVWITAGTIGLLATLVVLLVINVLQRRRALARLTESEAKFAQAFRASPVGMTILDLSTNRYLEINQRHVRTLGYPRDEVIGRTPGEIGWLAEADLPLLALERTSAGDWHDLEIRFRHKDGRAVICTCTAQKVRINERECLLSSLIDVTAQKRAEEERAKLEDQLAQALKMESIGRLAGGVAHDLNNMLLPILGYSELMYEELPADSPLLGHVAEITRAAERSRDLIRQLLAFARKQTLEMKPVDLNTVVNGFTTMLRRTLRENIAIEAKTAPGLPPLRGDSGQIERILLNLAVNAQDAMPGGGRLFIETSVVTLDASFDRINDEPVRPGPYLLLSVSDTGTGIPKEVLPKIFEPFFTTKAPGKGTGLGLATVYGIVRQHGGQLRVYSEEDRGTTFRVYLPALDTRPATGESAAPAGPSAIGGDERILLVEDEPQVRALTARILAQAGYSVHEAGDGRTARQLAESLTDPIDLMITDVVLPDLNGRALHLALGRERPSMRVLYMSGYTADVITHHGVLEEGVDFIQKPFNVAALVHKVREILDRGRNRAG